MQVLTREEVNKILQESEGRSKPSGNFSCADPEFVDELADIAFEWIKKNFDQKVK